jgi:uncharacterized protein YjbI with pentapeptide repeats
MSFRKLGTLHLDIDNLEFENLEFENLEFENLEFDNLEFDNLEFDNLEFDNLEFDNLEFNYIISSGFQRGAETLFLCLCKGNRGNKKNQHLNLAPQHHPYV